MVNAFVEFVKEYRKKNPSLSYKDAMKEAAKVYKKGDAVSKPKPAKKEKENIKMEISEVKEPKKDRQKKVKKYKKLAKEVEDDIGKSRITPKKFNEYVILSNVLAGKSAKNSYARHLKMVRRKLNTKKLKPLKEKLEKAKSESTELIDLLDKQKASNIKRPLKTQSKYSEEQNKMNRYRKILGEKISTFNKDPKNKGKAIPKSKFEKEAEEEAEELVITETIEDNLAKIATGKTLNYSEAYREYKKKNPKGTKTTFKPIYANMKKAHSKSKVSTKSAAPSRTVSVASTPSRTVSRTVSRTKKEDTDTGEETETVEGVITPKKKKSKKEKPKLTAQQLKNLKERKDEVKDDLEVMFVDMGRPDNAKLLRYVRQLETIQRKDPDADPDLDNILEKFQNLYDDITSIRASTKPARKTSATKKPKPTGSKTVGGKKPKSKEIIIDTDDDDDDDDAASMGITDPKPKKTKKIKRKVRGFKNRLGEEKFVSNSVVNDLTDELTTKLKGENEPTGEDKLLLRYMRNYSHLKYQKDGKNALGTGKSAVNAFLDNFIINRYGREHLLAAPAESDSSDDGAGRPLESFSEKALNMTSKVDDLLEELDNTYGTDKTDLGETEENMKEGAFNLYTGTPEARIEALFVFLKALEGAGKKNEIMKTLELYDDDEITFNIQKVIEIAYGDLGRIRKGIDKATTSGEGFANVEPINSVADLEESKGGALIDMIHRKLIKNNPKVSKQDEVDGNDKVFVKLNKEVYEKPDNRKANLEGYTYLAQQSDSENAVYQNQKDKKIIIAFRGSARLKDLKADLGIATGRLQNTSRHDSTEELVKKMKTLYPDYKITLTGHSLGGSLAISMSGKHNLPSVVFNAGHTIGKDNKESDITFYTKEGDPVSMLGANSYKNVKMIKGSRGNPIKDHSLSNFEGGSLMGDMGRAFLSQGMDTDATNRVKDAAEGLLKKGISSAVGVGSNMVKNSLNNSINDAFSGGSLVGGIKSKLMDYAKENSKVKKALLLRDIYKLVKTIKNDGFKKDMITEIGKIALDFNEI